MSVREVTRELFKRYAEMLPESHDCHKMAVKALGNIETWPIDKSSRWLGFVQAGVILEGLTTVDAERDFSRPLFHAAYEAEGIEIPESVTIK